VLLLNSVGLFSSLVFAFSSYSTLAVVMLVRQSSIRVAVSLAVVPTSNSLFVAVGSMKLEFTSAYIWIFWVGLLLFVYAPELFTSMYQSWFPAW